MVDGIEFVLLFDQGAGRGGGWVTAGAKIYGTCLRSDTSKVVEKTEDILLLGERDQGEESKRSILLIFFEILTFQLEGEGLNSRF